MPSEFMVPDVYNAQSSKENRWQVSAGHLTGTHQENRERSRSSADVSLITVEALLAGRSTRS